MQFHPFSFNSTIELHIINININLLNLVNRLLELLNEQDSETAIRNNDHINIHIYLKRKSIFFLAALSI